MSVVENFRGVSPLEDQIPSTFEAVVEPSFDEDRRSRMVNFAWLELTGNCQEECGHCYADSGPEGTHGTMTTEDWKRTIDELSENGTSMVQFIGGEPTLHPDLIPLINHALGNGMEVEVYSNLVHVTGMHWETFTQPGVRLATSYYSKDPAVHQEITRANTHNPIRRNIRRATELGIPLRVGIIGIQDNQDISGAVADLVSLGVDPDRIGTDYMRQVGRGVRDEVTPETTSQLCGNCAGDVIAVLPDGSVQPCVFSRQPDFTIGNVQEGSLAELFDSTQFTAVRGLLQEVFASRYPEVEGDLDMSNCQPTCNPRCNPELGNCNPTCRPQTNPCAPDACRPQCTPNTEPCNPYECNPTHACKPDLCRPER